MCSSQYTVPVLAYLCASPATRQPRAPSWLQGPRLKARRLPPVAVAGDRSHSKSHSHSKVFISTPEDTGPAHTQMKLQHRSRAPGPPYNSRTRSATGPGRETLSPARSRLKRVLDKAHLHLGDLLPDPLRVAHLRSRCKLLRVVYEERLAALVVPGRAVP